MSELFNKGDGVKDYTKLFIYAEFARFVVHTLAGMAKASQPGGDKKALRDDIVKEVKAFREKTKKKEAEIFPPVFHQEISKILWDR